MISLIHHHPLFVALFLAFVAIGLLLVALLWALSYTRKNVAWGYVRAPLPVATTVPKAIGVPTKWRREKWGAK